MAIFKEKTIGYVIALWALIFIFALIVILNTYSVITGVVMYFKIIFTFILGAFYGIASIRCYFLYPKQQYYEQNKARFSEPIKTDNIEAQKRERQNQYNFQAFEKYSNEYQAHTQFLYLCQGLISIAICIEFLGKYLICKLF